MEFSHRHVIVLPSVLVGSYDKMRLNFNVFFDPATFSSFGTSESFVLIRFPSADNPQTPSSTISLIARAIPLPAINNLCTSRGLQSSSCVGIDEDSLPILSHINSAAQPSICNVAGDVEIMPIPRYMLSPWQTLVFQSIEDTDEFFLPSPLALKEQLKKRPFGRCNQTPMCLPMKNKALQPFNAFGIRSQICLQNHDELSDVLNDWGVVSDETRVLVLSKTACHFPSVSEFDLTDLKATFEPNSVSKLASYISFNQSSSPNHSSLHNWIGKNLLLSGPAGSGKTTLVQSLCDNVHSRYVRITLSDIVSTSTLTGSDRLKSIYTIARQVSPCVMLFDDLHVIFPSGALSPESSELFSAFVQIIQDINSDQAHRVLLVSTTSVPLPSNIQHLFEDEVQLDVPSYSQRSSIFEFHSRKLPLQQSVRFERLSAMSNGYVGSDIVSACLMAFTLSQRRRLHANTDSSAVVTESDFVKAIQMTKPSQLGRDLGMPLFPTSDHDEGTQSSLWDRLGGLCETKQRLDRLVLLPMRNPTLIASSGSQAPHALLLYGPPGTGKTSLAKAIAQRAGAHFVSLNLADLLKSEVGESEKLVASVFLRARRCAPCIVFLDDVQTLLSKQDDSPHLAKVRAQLFFEMDRLALSPLSPSQKSDPAQSSDQLLPTVIVLAATNRPDLIDPSLVLRGGRFSEAIFVPLPTESERQQILQIFRASMPFDPAVSISHLAHRTASYSAADLQQLCVDAALKSMSRHGAAIAGQVEIRDFEDVLQSKSIF